MTAVETPNSTANSTDDDHDSEYMDDIICAVPALSHTEQSPLGHWSDHPGSMDEMGSLDQSLLFCSKPIGEPMHSGRSSDSVFTLGDEHLDAGDLGAAGMGSWQPPPPGAAGNAHAGPAAAEAAPLAGLLPVTSQQRQQQQATVNETAFSLSSGRVGARPDAAALSHPSFHDLTVDPFGPDHPLDRSAPIGDWMHNADMGEGDMGRQAVGVAVPRGGGDDARFSITIDDASREVVQSLVSIALQNGSDFQFRVKRKQ